MTKKLTKKLSFMVLILSMLLSQFSLVPVKALTGTNQLSITIKLAQWKLDEATNSLYAISEEGQSLLFINATTLTIDKTLPLAGKPTDIIQDNGKLYITLANLHKILVVDIKTKTIVDTLATTSDPYRIVKDGNSIYYAERDQWCGIYEYNLTTRKDTALSIGSVYNPDLALNVTNHILYIGESGSSGSNMFYYSTTEKKVLGRSTYDGGYGFPYPERTIIYDGQYVYYAGYKINPLDPTDLLGSYGGGTILLAKQGYVYTNTTIYNRDTCQVVKTYDSTIDLYERSSTPMLYLYSSAEQKIVKIDPSKALVTFNTLGGSLVPSTYATKNTVLQVPTAPTKTGYTFAGWYKDAGYTIPWNFTTDKVIGNITLYAKWLIVVQAPTSVKATSSSYNSINVSWTPVTGATGYQIYRATSSTGTYSLLTTTTSTNYVNTGLTYNAQYYYKIKAYRLVGSTNVYSNFSVVAGARPIVGVTSSIKAVSAGYNSINITWAPVATVSGYEVYRATSSTGTYSLIATTTVSSYNNTSLTYNATYYYKVRAYRLIGTTKVYGNFSTVFSAKPIVGVTSSIKAASTGYNSINITWTPVSTVSGYEVYRAPSSTGIYSLVTTTTSASFNNIGLATNTTYYYKVRAYSLVGTTKIYGNFSTIVTAKPIPATPSNLGLQETSNSNVIVSWSPVSGASGYTIYRTDSAYNPFLPIGNTTSSNYTIKYTDYKPGQTYYFIIRAYRYVGTEKVYSSNSKIFYVQFY